MVKKTYFMFASVFILCAIAFFGLVHILIGGILITLAIFIILLIHIVTQVFHLLISIAAIQKFMLYFFPSTESYIISIQNFVFKRIRWIYICYGIEETIAVYWVVSCIQGCTQEERLTIEWHFGIILLVLNSSLILCSFLYIPIMISVKKMSNLPMVQQTKPQKYIFWQAMMALMFKSTSVPVAIAFYFRGFDANFLMVILCLTDIIMTPLIIQISYLSCNKRNVDILLRVFCGCKRNPSSVEPESDPSDEDV